MSSEPSAKDKVGFEDARLSFPTQDVWPTSSDGTPLEDGLSEMRSGMSDSDADTDLISQACAAGIKAPEVDRPPRRRPWGNVRAQETHAKTGHHVDGQDHVSQSNQPCHNRKPDRRRAVSAPTMQEILELSQKITVTEIRSELPSFRSETSKPEDVCRDSHCSESDCLSPKTPKTKSTHYCMLRFNATPTLSTSCGPVKAKRACSARKRVTASPELESVQVATQESLPDMCSIEQDTALTWDLSKPENACRESECSHFRSDSFDHSPKITSTQSSMLSFNATSTLSIPCDPGTAKRPCSARKRATKSAEAAGPELHSGQVASQDSLPDTMCSLETRPRSARKLATKSAAAAGPELESGQVTSQDSFPDTMCSFETRPRSARKLATKLAKAASPELESRQVATQESLPDMCSFETRPRTARKRTTKLAKAAGPELELGQVATEDSLPDMCSFETRPRTARKRTTKLAKAAGPELELGQVATEDSLPDMCSFETRPRTARKRLTKSALAAGPELVSGQVASLESLPDMSSFEQDTTPTETLDSFLKMSSGEAHSALQNYMREALCSRAPAFDNPRRFRGMPE